MERFVDDIRLNHPEFDNPRRIEAALERLIAQKVPSNDGFLMSPVSTLPAKVFELMQCGTRRTVDLTDSAIRELNNRNVSAACMLVRSCWLAPSMLKLASRIVHMASKGRAE
jgi:hypothetical protein